MLMTVNQFFLLNGISISEIANITKRDPRTIRKRLRNQSWKLSEIHALCSHYESLEPDYFFADSINARMICN